MKMLNYLLENGGSSIRYSIKRELYNQDKISEELLVLQNAIMNNPKVRKIIDKQRFDGWIAHCHFRTFLLSSGIRNHPSFTLSNLSAS